MAKDLDFDQLYPNRFLKSGEFGGRDVTLTIADVKQEELEGSSGKKMKVIIVFRETKKEWVAPKTCGICLKGMFGRKTSAWIGKRVTLFPTDVTAFGEIVQAIRVRGSPDITEPLEFEEQLGRAKAKFKVVPTGQRPANGNGRAPARTAQRPVPPPPPAATEDGSLPFDPPETSESLFND